MTLNKLWLCVSLSLICFHGTGAFPFCVVHACVFNSTELQDIQYTQSFMFNEEHFTKWDSRVGKYVGYSELGVKVAEIWNNNPAVKIKLKAAREDFCKPNIKRIYSNVLNRTVKPYVRLTSAMPSDPTHTHKLVCSCYDFYPKPIKVTWLRDGEPATSDVTSTDEKPDGDWYYQYHSDLEYTPRSGEKISCMVEHSSLSVPIFEDWDDSMPEADRNRMAIGASGLVLGGVLFLSGFIYYRWKKHGRVLMPTTEEMQTAIAAP